MVSGEELDRRLRAADIVCVPSRYESHSVVIVEAMMFGKPVVSCRTGGVPEVVQDGHNALLAPPGDAAALTAGLRRLIEDRDLRVAFGWASRRRFDERFAIGVVAPRMASLFADVAREHAASGAGGHDPADGGVSELLGELEREHPVSSRAREAALAAVESRTEPNLTDLESAPAFDSRWSAQELLVHRRVGREWAAEAALELDLAYRQRQTWAERAAELDRVARAAGQRLVEIEHQARAALERVDELEGHSRRQEQHARELRRTLDLVSRSSSWRLTGPLRRAATWRRGLRDRRR
jgi:hypothetical protein